MAQFFELGKPSLLQQNLAFGNVKMLVVEPDFRQSTVTKNIIFSLGCTQVTTVREGESAIAALQENHYDLAICSWELPDMTGLELTRYIRRDPSSTQPMLPMIMVSNHNALRDVLQARDSGITEYLIRPFSSKALIEHIYMLAEQPRQFVLSADFSGPDRRRTNPVKQLLQATGRDDFVKRRPPVIVSRDTLSNPEAADDGQAKIILPDYNLKLKVGLYVPEELQQLSVASEKSLHAAKQNMLGRLKDKIISLREQLEVIETHLEEKQAVRALQQSAQMIAQESLLIGYYYAADIAELLNGFCSNYVRPEDANHQLILEKHIEVLEVVFAQHLSEDGGYLGEAMRTDLSRLILKYAA